METIGDAWMGVTNLVQDQVCVRACVRVSVSITHTHTHARTHAHTFL